MAQLSLFNESEHVEFIVPVDVISPLESNKGVKTKAFKEQQERWSKYVSAIQNHQKCSWFDARDLLIKHRDQQIPIKVIWQGGNQ